MLNKGFSLLEMLLVVFIISLVNYLFILPSIDLTSLFKLATVSNDLTRVRIQSIFEKTNNCYSSTDLIMANDLCFNEFGNPNQAQTMRLNQSNKLIVIHLGSGTYEIK